MPEAVSHILVHRSIERHPNCLKDSKFSLVFRTSGASISGIHIASAISPKSAFPLFIERSSPQSSARASVFSAR